MKECHQTSAKKISAHLLFSVYHAGTLPTHYISFPKKLFFQTYDEYAKTRFTPPTAPSVLVKGKIAYALWFSIYTQFPKTHRYTLGGKVESYFLDLLELIFISLYLSPEQKIPKLTLAVSKLEGIKFFLQLAWENKCISQTQYIQLSEQLAEMGRILYGWKKGLEKKTPAKN